MAFHGARTPSQIRREQRRFVRELSSNVLKSIIKKIDDHKVPKDWDGIELRQYLADKFAEASFTMDEKHNRRRRRDYRNAVRVGDL